MMIMIYETTKIGHFIRYYIRYFITSPRQHLQEVII
jgi:hypothetical protein